MNKKLLTMLAPVLGAGAIGVCPLCWLGSASLLTYLGLGALIPVWRWLAFGLIAIGAIGFMFDYRSHKNPRPLVMLIAGGILLYVGRYVFASTWGAWWIWIPGALLIIGAVVYNKRLFRKTAPTSKNMYTCPECGFRYKEKQWADRCESWCKERHSCNLDIIKFAEPEQ